MIEKAKNKTAIQAGMGWLAQQDGAEYPEAVRAYFGHYGLHWPELEHRFGWFESGGLKLAAHLYCPAKYRATAVLVHGYLNHTGQLRHLIRYLTERQIAVAVFDLPGHGLSDGEAAAIDSFDQYTQAMDDFLAVVRPRLAGPYAAVGFSLGGAIVMEMLAEGRMAAFEKIVLAAPLIHWSLYEQSKGTFKIYSTFTDRISRFYQKNSSDKAYLAFNKTQDTLHCTSLSLRWVKALFDWNEKIERMAPCPRPILILQGDRDTTVDWRYNIRLLRDKFPAGRVERIHGARHELFNEAIEYRRQAMDLIGDYFRQD
jgi:alpha-beta hydrolase superfamily lysophospholipase